MTDDLSGRHEGGPLERPHVRELIQKNLLENTVFEKKSRCIETEKKAIVRACSKGEFEMKILLQRLQLEQQNIANSEDTDHSSDSEGTTHDTETEDNPTGLPACDWNPYPVTIIPKYGTCGPVSPNKNKTGHDIVGNSVSSVDPLQRRKSVEFEDIQDSLTLTSSAVSRVSSGTSMGDIQRRRAMLSHDLQEDWVGNPAAILSVRRARRSVSEQAHQKMLMRSQTELILPKDREASSPTRSGTVSSPRGRSNSFKEKRGNDESSVPTPTTYKRGGSLKERRSGAVIGGDYDKNGNKAVARSFSMLSRLSSKDIERMDNGRRGRKNSSSKEDPLSPRFQDGQASTQRSKKTGLGSSSGDSMCSKDSMKEIDIQQLAKKTLIRNNTPPKMMVPLSFSSSLDENALRSALGPRRRPVIKATPGPIKTPDHTEQPLVISPLAKEPTVTLGTVKDGK